jgi:hypothetical protein
VVRRATMRGAWPLAKRPRNNTFISAPFRSS